MIKKKIIAIPSIITLLTVLTIIIAATTPLIQTVYATWYTVNADPNLNNANAWTVGTWHESSSYIHDYYIQNGQAYTRFKTSGFNKWGNTQYGQGDDIWSYWTALTDIPANYPQRVICNTYTQYKSANFAYGRMNQYIELWLEHPTGDGTKNYKYAEVMIVLDSHGYIYPAEAGQNGYWARERNEPDVSWYYVGYRHWNMNYQQWTYRETNVNAILNQMSTVWGCDLSEWTITGLSFGVEGTSGEMRALFDYVYYDVGM